MEDTSAQQTQNPPALNGSGTGPAGPDLIGTGGSLQQEGPQVPSGEAQSLSGGASGAQLRNASNIPDRIPENPPLFIYGKTKIPVVPSTEQSAKQETPAAPTVPLATPLLRNGVPKQTAPKEEKLTTPDQLVVAKKKFPKKVVIIPLVLFFLGIGAFSGFLLLGQQKSATIPPPVVQQEPTPTVATVQQVPFVVQFPLDGEIVTTKDIVIKGSAAPDSAVVVFSDYDQHVLQALPSGAFEGKFALSPGLNEITLAIETENGQGKTETRIIVYETE